MTGARAWAERWLALANTPRDAAGLSAFRILLGAVLLGSVLRFAAKGWINELYEAPSFHFTYLGFEWVRPWTGWGMALHFAVMGLAAASLVVGFRSRLSAALFFATFSYAELADKTTYLNHYYLVSLLTLLLAFMPAGAVWSLDARRAGRSAVQVGAWCYGLLRAQLAVVYVYAGIAKLGEDWLFCAEPLASWLPNYAETPLIGPLLAERWLAFVLSYFGAAYDLLIVPLLLWKRTRKPAYAAVLVFHVTTWALFPIGVFSLVMIAATTVFFEPSWPRRLHASLRQPPAGPALGKLSPIGGVLAAAYLLVQVLLPMRALLYPGPVNWTEEGFRFAWRVMLIEKVGSVEYEIHASPPARRFVVHPSRELTPFQYRMMSTQPDMIHEYALHLAERYRALGYTRVEVHAHAWAALNGRARQRLIDPEVDLAAVARSFGRQRFIVPLEDETELKRR